MSRTPGGARAEPRVQGRTGRRARACAQRSRLAGAAAALALVAASCGPSVPAPGIAPRSAGAPPPPWSPDPAGWWRWTMVTEEDGARRVEIETWHLEGHGDALTGTLARTVTFLSTNGTPFACNQALTYRQDALFRLAGRRDASGLRLRELEHRALPSPCDDGRRAYLRYRGRLVRDTLALTWDGGSQTLRRLPGSSGPGAGAGAGPGARDARVAPHLVPPIHDDGTIVRALPAGAPASAPVAGAWRWQGRSTRPDTGEVRVEIEDWALAEDAAGNLTGTITRTVTGFDRDGRVFGCSGETYYQYRDRYTVRGRRDGPALTLHEHAVAPDQHPCVRGAGRHLDAATGAVLGRHLVLTWRGQRRQVLRRPPAGE